jgi:hypothetical protein
MVIMLNKFSSSLLLVVDVLRRFFARPDPDVVSRTLRPRRILREEHMGNLGGSGNMANITECEQGGVS